MALSKSRITAIIKQTVITEFKQQSNKQSSSACTKSRSSNLIWTSEDQTNKTNSC